MTDKLEELYDHYNKLDAAKDNISEFESSYLAILLAVKGSSPEKQLCSQFISKFFVQFPDYYEASVDAIFDLCEDDDINIRRRAIRELPNICRQKNEFVPRFADVLSQLLQTDDNNELSIVNQSLIALAKYSAKGFFEGIFSQINGDEVTDVVRERCIKFLKDRLKLIPSDILTKEVEEFFLEKSRKVMQDVTKDEFITFMTLLSSLKISKSLSGQQTLMEIVKEQAELNNPFDPSDLDSVDKLLMSIKHGLPFFSPFVPSTEFVTYLCLNVLSELTELETKQSGIELDVLQMLAEMSPFVSPNTESIEIENCLTKVFTKLLEYMPTPPPIEITDVSNGTNGTDEPTLQFSHIECLLFTFQQLCKLNPQFLSDSQSERVKDFKLRLQYVARGVQSYITKLRKHLSTVKGEALKSEDNKLKVMALKTTNNINVLIRDLFKIPPSFKSSINLSWKPPTAKSVPISPVPVVTTAAVIPSLTETETKPSKRQPITAPEGSEPKRERKIYAPPEGKFSSGMKGNGYNPNRGSKPGFRGGRGRGRGGFRGGGRGFNRGFQRWNN